MRRAGVIFLTSSSTRLIGSPRSELEHADAEAMVARLQRRATGAPADPPRRSSEMGARESLYDRIGGETTIASAVDAFYQRVLTDPELAPFFADTSMEKLRRMQHEFFCAALGGPIEYSGRPLAHVHYGRGIQPRHLRRFVEHLVATLRDRGIGEDDVVEIADQIQTYADEITGQTSVDG